MLHTVTRRPILQKVRDQTISSWKVVLSLLVSIQFQVLFHSPPGVLFTVPSRYYSLSVTKSYLAFGGGPPIFTLVRLSNVTLDTHSYHTSFAYEAFTLFRSPFQVYSTTSLQLNMSPKPHRYCYPWFGLLPFRSPLLR